MKLSEIKNDLKMVETVQFKLPSGAMVPENFHVTEVGLVTKHFIDCGGTERIEKMVNFQLWDAMDYDHRLKPSKLSTIIALSEKKLGLGDLDIEVEYQSDTIGKYGLEFDGKDFILVSKKTACLAEDACGITDTKQKISLQDLSTKENQCCTPGSGCC